MRLRDLSLADIGWAVLAVVVGCAGGLLLIRVVDLVLASLSVTAHGGHTG